MGLYFVGVIVYLLSTAVLPITQGGEWRTIIDVIAVGSYFLVLVFGHIAMIAVMLDPSRLGDGMDAMQDMPMMHNP